MPITIFRQILRLTPVVVLTWSLGASANAALIRPEASGKLTYQKSPQVRRQQKQPILPTGLQLLPVRQLQTVARILGSATGSEQLLAQQLVMVHGENLSKRKRYQVFSEHSRLADKVMLQQIAELCLLPDEPANELPDQLTDAKLDRSENGMYTGQGRLLRATREVRPGDILLPTASADGC